MRIITNSEVRARRDCPRKHFWTYEQGFRPRTSAHALRFGSAWHAMLEDLKEGRAPDPRAEEWQLSPVDVIKLECLITGYFLKWGKFSPTHEAEVGFEAPLLHPDTWETHPTCRIAGKIDGIDGTTLWEHKTSSEISDNYWIKLQMDSQLLQYVVGAESLSRPIESIVYDVVRKPTIEPLEATPPEKRRKKKDGNYYKDVRLKPETLDDYRARLASDISERPDHYSERRTLARNESQVRQHLLNLWDWAELMEGPAPQNPDACNRFGLCPFWDCCSTGSEPADHPSIYHRIEERHPELV